MLRRRSWDSTQIPEGIGFTSENTSETENFPMDLRPSGLGSSQRLVEVTNQPETELL